MIRYIYDNIFYLGCQIYFFLSTVICVIYMIAMIGEKPEL